MRIIVCGGRDYAEADRVKAIMNDVCHGIDCDKLTIIHGGATGADYLAGEWAKRIGANVEVYEADWARYGGWAGGIRNQRMLIQGKPDLVVAFPGGRGTRDMVRRAAEGGVEVKLVQ